MSTQTAVLIQKETITFSKPGTDDGASMWELVNQSTLDKNSAYKYVMMSEFFSDTCVVAKRKGKVIGFVTGFIQPERPDTIFVWQIGIDSEARGEGLASRLLAELLSQNEEKEIRYVEATVTPSNTASRSLFQSFARKQKTKCRIRDCFETSHFPESGDDHEAEELFRIGPFK
ncbi:diaminobutyrate acetyltransferase [Shouchella shacheensis]|uniref:diaminobutyrate acetyltransferase n=1 Tax=Shouchella shacheensis TaxID=1649580 RepID=UPI000A714A15|nr:diaminobutyrate acetyltransferase [Shouchella shacheensis]